MKSKSVSLARILAALAVAGGLAVASVPASSQPGTDGNTATQHEHMRKHIGQRLDKMAARLQITPAQQTAWTQYRNAVEAQVGTPSAPPAADADAASVVRWRAQRASDAARKLNVVADATATLQAVLSSEQQKTLGDIVRREGRFGRHHEGRGEGKPTAM
ncbi:MAG TPA: Spy/CpxP family protein refolding chaperone [Burkholderiales bacterium]|nr:Spy/CpxP family protein refolding chaperone [Burkholderiales bacterium]